MSRFFPIISALLALAPSTWAQREVDDATLPSNPPATLIIGFTGGFLRHDDPVRGEVRFAQHLRDTYSSCVRVETYENWNAGKAHQAVLKFLREAQHSNSSLEDPKVAAIILYGHSWGAAAALSLARMLQRDGIPVRLTVQIDSVAPPGVNDAVVPSNVARAANFFERGGLFHGRSKIRAADASRTQIVGNFEFNYRKNPVSCPGYPLWNRVLAKRHVQIECDPKVWEEVEGIIRQELPWSTRVQRAGSSH